MKKINNSRFSPVSGLLGLLFSSLLVLSACGPALSPVEKEAGGPRGSLDFSVDLGALGLASAPTGSRGSATVTAVSVQVSRDGYATISTNLSVSANVAKGTVSSLDAGYWHVTAKVQDGATVLFTGEADVNVLAGSAVPCVLLFDPVVVEPTTGSIELTVGLNPLPGYKALGVAAPVVLAGKDTVYVVDTAAKVVGVYNEAMVRTKDIKLPEAPSAATLNVSKTRILLGYPNGALYSLDPSTQGLTKVGDALMAIRDLVSVSDRYLIAIGPQVKSLDLTTSQIITTNAYWYTLQSFAFDPATSTVYAGDSGVSPSDIHRIRVDLSSGAIGSITDSPYHGTYSLGAPVRVIKNGTRLATASGTLFNCSTILADDLIYAGSLAVSYFDLAFDSTKDRTYILGNTALKKLLVLDGTTDFTLQSIDLLGDPKWVFVTNNKVIVFVQSSGQYYSRVFVKADLL